MEGDFEQDTQSIVHGTELAALGRQPYLCMVLVASDLSQASSRHCLSGIATVGFRRGTACLVERHGDELTVYVNDQSMSGRHAVLERRGGAWVLSDSGSKNGTLINGARCEGAQPLENGDLLEFGSSFFVFYSGLLHRPTDDLDFDAERLATTPQGFGTLDPDLGFLFRDLARLAESRTPVLINGPTGTGKELVARAIHSLSSRDGRFIAVNSGAIADTLLESELFGHVKVAFSGATADREGLITASDGGTLFLDEVGELSARAQVSLLRAIQEQEVMPVGSTVAESVDLRIVAATHRDLQKMVRSGDFREDLWARLNGFSLELPPLSERRQDLGMIVDNLLRRHHPGTVTKMSVGAVRFLFEYGWPRNIRELERALVTAAALAADGRIERQHLERSLGSAQLVGLPEDDEGDMRVQLVRLLETHAGNLTHVAAAMGKKRQQIQRWCKRYDIDANAYRG